MLYVHKISKSFGIATVLENISFVINPGERVALVGPNGSGKSTLFRIICGEVPADTGAVSLAPGVTLGYLPQGLAVDETQDIETFCWSAVPGLAEARQVLSTLAQVLETHTGSGLSDAMSHYGEAQHRFESLDGYAFESRMAAILAGLGLADLERWRLVRELSGGQRTRLSLARLLLSQPSLLLLDEPTNHLDLQALGWLENFIASYAGSVLLVSHDRAFLDNTVTRVLALDNRTHSIKAYTGNYTAFAQAREREIQAQVEQWIDQEVEIGRMEQDIHRTKHQALSVELTTTSRQPGVRRIAKKVAKKAASREKKLNRYLASEDRVEKPLQGWEMKLDFVETLRSGQIALALDGVSFAYPGQAPLFADLALGLTYGDRVVFAGPNGSGKSTLLRVIVGELPPHAGTVRLGTNVRVGYMPQEQENLPPEATPLSIIQSVAGENETAARNFLHYFLFAGDEVFTPVSRLSYGERARLLLAKMVVEGANFLVLDEPTNHLDIPSRERFEIALRSFPGTVLISTHDRTLMDKLAQKIWYLDRGQVRLLSHREEIRL